MKSTLLNSIPGIRHGFGNRAEAFPLELEPAFQRTRPKWKQVHGTALAEVTAPGQDCGEVDALTTALAGVPIAVVSADCVPILLARADGSRVAAVHAGWRGTRARILERVIEKLRGQLPRDGEWVAAIGPAIGPCCYEVSEELAADFAREFGPGAVPRFRHLDLPEVARAELGRLGVKRVDLIRACTRCTRGISGDFLYQSYRREGAGTRQYSAIERR